LNIPALRFAVGRATRQESAKFAEEAPGFAVGAEEAVSAGVAFGIEEKTGAVGDEGDGEDEPGVLGNDVGDEEVDLGGAIGDGGSAGAAMTVDVIEAVEKSSRRFDLNADEAATGVKDEVVAFAVAVGFGDAKAHGGGFVGEGEFGEFASALGGEFTLAGRFLTPFWRIRMRARRAILRRSREERSAAIARLAQIPRFAESARSG